jgi:hypothetical protein
VLNELAESLLGATDRKGCPNNTFIMNSHGSKLSCAKNEEQKNTAFDCRLSPTLNGFPRPTSMFRGALRLSIDFLLVNISLIFLWLD